MIPACPTNPLIAKGGERCLALFRADPEDRRRRVVDGLARCFVLSTDRIVHDPGMLVPFLDPVADAERDRRPWDLHARFPPPSFVKQFGRKAALERIAEGGLGIDVGPWNGSFWRGLRLSGALRRGPGTEFRVWEKSRRELVADLDGMPLMRRLEPKAAKGGQRRLRRCYAALLPPEDATGRSLLAGLFAGAAPQDDGGEAWLELPDDEAVRGVLDEWGIPFLRRERAKGQQGVRVSPLFGALVAHLMPPHCAARILAIGKAGGCPFLSAVLWKMAMAGKGRRHMPFPDALPFGASRATFFRRGWHRRDLRKEGWLELGIRITPRLRELLADWFERKRAERAGAGMPRYATPPSPPPIH